MAEPTTPSDWATDTNYATGPDSGLPTKETPEPSSGVVAQGFVPGDPLFAPRLNRILNTHHRWVQYFRSFFSADELVYPTPKSRFKWVDIQGLAYPKQYVDTGGGASPIDLGNLDGWWPEHLVIFGPPDIIGLTGAYVCNVPNLLGIKGISHLLTKAMTLTAVRFRVHMFTAEATAGERMQVSVYKRNISTDTVTTLGTAAIANLTTIQNVDVTFSDAIDTDTFTYYVEVRSSQNCTSISPDKIVGIRLAYTEAALRTD